MSNFISALIVTVMRAWSVCPSVGNDRELLGKMANQIMLVFRVLRRVHPRNRVLRRP